MAYIGKAPASGIRSRFIYTATAGQTSFSGSDDHSRTLNYSDAEFVDVYLNGVKLDKSDYTATSGTSVVLDEGAAVDDILEVVAYDTFSVFNGEFSQDVTVGADLTVDTNTLHVDSTNNRVGIGTSSPDSNLHLTDSSASTTTHVYTKLHIEDSDNSAIQFSGSTGGEQWIWFADDTSSTPVGGLTYYHGGEYMAMRVAGAERMRIDNTGDVCIGTTSAYGTNVLNVNGGIAIDGRSQSTPGLCEKSDTNTGIFWPAADTLGVSTAGSERMRIDSSGNALIGKTVTSSSTQGIALKTNGQGVFTSDGGSSVFVNRKTSDGTIIDVRKDGATVGSIGNKSTTLYVSSSQAGGLRFTYDSGSPIIAPCDTAGANLDNSADLGFASARFDDIYATNATIQTSDQNEKQQIASLTAAEITAAKAISKLFKTFKWNSSVTENGDNARTHAGVIAQDVQQAMTDAGLDAGDYAFFISNTWWETSTDVPAVAAVAAQDAVYDDDGNLVTAAVEAVEAQDAYTRVDTYDTQADAPAGATERTRLGIRYPELLAFVGAATEQRLADIETRIAALEAN